LAANSKSVGGFAVQDNKVRPLHTIHALYGQIQPDAVGATPITSSEDPHFDLQLHLGRLFLKPPAENEDDNGEDSECFEIVVMNPDDEED
jgi:hypothetical protein